MENHDRTSRDSIKEETAAKQEILEFVHTGLVRELIKQSKKPLSESEAELLSREALEHVDIFSKEYAEQRLDWLAETTLQQRGYQIETK